ncbi:MAG TPA: hypothetical protein PLV59_03685 [Candidatus Dojkabacteria bacterium]|mgnify:CR=1 FL=1|nr:hypothetical protein [Candidatus Dojkabacteria bacterium]
MGKTATILFITGAMIASGCSAAEAPVVYETPTRVPNLEPAELLIPKTMVINHNDKALEFYLPGIAYRSFIPEGGILEKLFTSADEGAVSLDQAFETHPTGYTLSPYHLLRVLRPDGIEEDYTTTEGSFAITFADENLDPVVYIIEVARDRTAVEVGRVVNPANDLVLP